MGRGPYEDVRCPLPNLRIHDATMLRGRSLSGEFPGFSVVGVDTWLELTGDGRGEPMRLERMGTWRLVSGAFPFLEAPVVWAPDVDEDGTEPEFHAGQGSKSLGGGGGGFALISPADLLRDRSARERRLLFSRTELWL